jgi:hypothetical protein
MKDEDRFEELWKLVREQKKCVMECKICGEFAEKRFDDIQMHLSFFIERNEKIQEQKMKEDCDASFEKIEKLDVPNPTPKPNRVNPTSSPSYYVHYVEGKVEEAKGKLSKKIETKVESSKPRYARKEPTPKKSIVRESKSSRTARRIRRSFQILDEETCKKILIAQKDVFSKVVLPELVENKTVQKLREAEKVFVGLVIRVVSKDFPNHLIVQMVKHLEKQLKTPKFSTSLKIGEAISVRRDNSIFFMDNNIDLGDFRFAEAHDMTLCLIRFGNRLDWKEATPLLQRLITTDKARLVVVGLRRAENSSYAVCKKFFEIPSSNSTLKQMLAGTGAGELIMTFIETHIHMNSDSVQSLEKIVVNHMQPIQKI